MVASYRGFQGLVLPVMIQKGIGMKRMGGNCSVVATAGVTGDQGLGNLFSLPISTLAWRVDSEKVLDQNLKIVRYYKPTSGRPSRS
jgi:hypothetical protein